MEAGTRCTLNYPEAFVTLPDYTARAGQVVTVVRELTADEADVEAGRMFRVVAADGWTGDAFEDELETVTGIPAMELEQSA